MVDHTEQQLIQLLKDQESRYTAAIELIDRLSQASSLSDSTSRSEVMNLQRHLASVRTLGTQLATATSEWESRGKPRSSALAEMLNRQEKVLSNFLGRMEEVQKVFGADRDQLKIRLDQSSSHKSMHAAYQKTLKTG